MNAEQSMKAAGRPNDKHRAGEETVWDLMGRAIFQSLLFLGVFLVVSVIAG